MLQLELERAKEATAAALERAAGLEESKAAAERAAAERAVGAGDVGASAGSGHVMPPISCCDEHALQPSCPTESW